MKVKKLLSALLMSLLLANTTFVCGGSKVKEKDVGNGTSTKKQKPYKYTLNDLPDDVVQYVLINLFTYKERLKLSLVSRKFFHCLANHFSKQIIFWPLKKFLSKKFIRASNNSTLVNAVSKIDKCLENRKKLNQKLNYKLNNELMTPEEKRAIEMAIAYEFNFLIFYKKDTILKMLKNSPDCKNVIESFENSRNTTMVSEDNNIFNIDENSDLSELWSFNFANPFSDIKGLDKVRNLKILFINCCKASLQNSFFNFLGDIPSTLVQLCLYNVRLFDRRNVYVPLIDLTNIKAPKLKTLRIYSNTLLCSGGVRDFYCYKYNAIVKIPGQRGDELLVSKILLPEHKNIPEIETLALKKYKVTKDTVESIANYKSLKKLELSEKVEYFKRDNVNYLNVRDEIICCVNGLKKLTKLIDLELKGPFEYDFKLFTNFKNLEGLKVDYYENPNIATFENDNNIQSLGSLEKLKYFTIAYNDRDKVNYRNRLILRMTNVHNLSCLNLCGYGEQEKNVKIDRYGKISLALDGNLSKLKTITLSYMCNVDLSFLEKLPNLEYLKAQNINNPVKEIDITTLPKLKTLIILKCNICFKGIENLTNLISLYLAESRGTIIKSFENLNKVEWLILDDLNYDNIVKLEDIGQLENLINLRIYINFKFTNLDFVKPLNKLKVLDIQRSQYFTEKDFSVLSEILTNNKNIEVVNLRNSTFILKKLCNKDTEIKKLRDRHPKVKILY